MTPDEFLQWSLDQEDKYELVDGEPVLMGDWVEEDGRTTFMAGAKNEHDIIVVNLIVALAARLRGGPCRPFTGDTAARMVAGNIRRPDVTVDCKPPERGSTESRAPTVFFEVLSRSTRGADLIRKADEYRQVSSLRHYVVIEPLSVHVTVWTRSGDGAWPVPVVLKSLDGSLDLSGISVSLPLTEIYDGVPFESRSSTP